MRFQTCPMLRGRGTFDPSLKLSWISYDPLPVIPSATEDIYELSREITRHFDYVRGTSLNYLISGDVLRDCTG